MSMRSPEHNQKIGEALRKRAQTPTKVCPSCKRELDRATDYGVRGTGQTKSYCKDCEAAKQREKWAARTEAQRIHSARVNRAFKLMRDYGVTLEWYEETLVAQEGRCAVCKNEASANGRALAVDHDHHSGQPRSILCDLCNRGLGMFRDDPALLRRAAEYVESHLADTRT